MKDDAVAIRSNFGHRACSPVQSFSGSHWQLPLQTFSQHPRRRFFRRIQAIASADDGTLSPARPAVV
jgi:hypothetical protein